MMVTLEPHIELQLGLKEKQWQLSHAQVLLHNVDNQAVLLDRLLEEAASLFNRIGDPSVDEDAQKRMKAKYDAVKAKAQVRLRLSGLHLHPPIHVSTLICPFQPLFAYYQAVYLLSIYLPTINPSTHLFPIQPPSHLPTHPSTSPLNHQISPSLSTHTPPHSLIYPTICSSTYPATHLLTHSSIYFPTSLTNLLFISSNNCPPIHLSIHSPTHQPSHLFLTHPFTHPSLHCLPLHHLPTHYRPSPTCSSHHPPT